MQKQLMRLSRSIVGPAEAKAVTGVLEGSGYLGMGEEVRLFEQEIAAYLGVNPEQVICVNTGTAALHLALEAVLPPQSEILIPSLTYVASFQAALAANCVPVACDVSLDSGLLNLDDAAKRITPKTRAVMPVHYASNPALLNTVYDFANEFNLRVIEDAAHCFGCTYNNKPVGCHGDLVCFSFDGIKNITSGEGGAVVTRDIEAARLIKDARLLSVENDTVKRYQGERSWDFDVKARGFRYHMSNIMAAIGRAQLKRLDSEFAPARQALAARYRQLLAEHGDVALLKMDMNGIVPHIMPVRILNGKRELAAEALRQAGIPTGLHYKPAHLLTLFGGGKPSLPAAETLGQELLTLPLHPALSSADVELVCATLLRAC